MRTEIDLRSIQLRSILVWTAPRLDRSEIDLSSLWESVHTHTEKEKGWGGGGGGGCGDGVYKYYEPVQGEKNLLWSKVISGIKK